MTKSIQEQSDKKKRGRPRAFDRAAALENSLDVFGQQGYEASSISQLCSAMNINPPSLYAAFGSKAELFEEAVSYYKEKYWAQTWKEMNENEDVFLAIEEFFTKSTEILTDQHKAKGCMLVYSAANISIESREIVELLQDVRRNSLNLFENRILKAIEDKQFPSTTDAHSIALVLKAILDGIALQAKDGASEQELKPVVKYVKYVLGCCKECINQIS